jgi:hypothetical protein
MASALGMQPRSYEYFESGRGKLNVLRAHAAARILDADPLALLIAVDIGSPDFAVRCIDNKLATALLVVVAEFDADAGDAIALLDSATLIAAFHRAFDGLAAQARERSNLSKTWKRLGAKSPPDHDDDFDPGDRT